MSTAAIAMWAFNALLLAFGLGMKAEQLWQRSRLRRFLRDLEEMQGGEDR